MSNINLKDLNDLDIMSREYLGNQDVPPPIGRYSQEQMNEIARRYTSSSSGMTKPDDHISEKTLGDYGIFPHFDLDARKALSEAQSWSEQAWNGFAGGVMIGAASALEGFSYLFDLEGIVNDMAGVESINSNWFADKMNQFKDFVREDYMPIYRSSDDIWKWDGGAFIWDSLRSVLDTGIGFAIPGGAVGKVGSLIRASKVLSKMNRAVALSKVRNARKGAMIQDFIPTMNQMKKVGDITQTLGTGLVTNFIEGQVMGLELYERALDEQMDLVREGKITYAEARENASRETDAFRNHNRLFALTDAFQISGLFKTASITRTLLKDPSFSIKRTGLEFLKQGAGEYLEEIGQKTIEEHAMERVMATAEGRDPEPYMEKMLEYASTAEAQYEGFLGFFAGGAQRYGTAALSGYYSKKNRQARMQQYEGQQKMIQDLQKDMIDVFKNEGEMAMLKEIAAATGNEEVVNGLDDAQFTNLVIRNLALGNVQNLENLLLDVKNMPEETAKKKGYPEDYKEKAASYLEKIPSLEKKWKSLQGYYNPVEIMFNNVKQDIVKKDIARVQKELNESKKDRDVLVSVMDRTDEDGKTNKKDFEKTDKLVEQKEKLLASKKKKLEEFYKEEDKLRSSAHQEYLEYKALIENATDEKILKKLKKKIEDSKIDEKDKKNLTKKAETNIKDVKKKVEAQKKAKKENNKKKSSKGIISNVKKKVNAALGKNKNPQQENKPKPSEKPTQAQNPKTPTELSPSSRPNSNIGSLINEVDKVNASNATPEEKQQFYNDIIQKANMTEKPEVVEQLKDYVVEIVSEGVGGNGLDEAIALVDQVKKSTAELDVGEDSNELAMPEDSFDEQYKETKKAIKNIATMYGYSDYGDMTFMELISTYFNIIDDTATFMRIFIPLKSVWGLMTGEDISLTKEEALAELTSQKKLIDTNVAKEVLANPEQFTITVLRGLYGAQAQDTARLRRAFAVSYLARGYVRFGNRNYNSDLFEIGMMDNYNPHLADENQFSEGTAVRFIVDENYDGNINIHRDSVFLSVIENELGRPLENNPDQASNKKIISYQELKRIASENPAIQAYMHEYVPIIIEGKNNVTGEWEAIGHVQQTDYITIASVKPIESDNGPEISAEEQVQEQIAMNKRLRKAIYEYPQIASNHEAHGTVIMYRGGGRLNASFDTSGKGKPNPIQQTVFDSFVTKMDFEFGVAKESGKGARIATSRKKLLKESEYVNDPKTLFPGALYVLIDHMGKKLALGLSPSYGTFKVNGNEVAESIRLALKIFFSSKELYEMDHQGIKTANETLMNEMKKTHASQDIIDLRSIKGINKYLSLFTRVFSDDEIAADKSFNPDNTPLKQFVDNVYVEQAKGKVPKNTFVGIYNVQYNGVTRKAISFYNAETNETFELITGTNQAFKLDVLADTLTNNVNNGLFQRIRLSADLSHLNSVKMKVPMFSFENNKMSLADMSMSYKSFLAKSHKTNVEPFNMGSFDEPKYGVMINHAFTFTGESLIETVDNISDNATKDRSQTSFSRAIEDFSFVDLSNFLTKVNSIAFFRETVDQDIEFLENLRKRFLKDIEGIEDESQLDELINIYVNEFIINDGVLLNQRPLIAFLNGKSLLRKPSKASKTTYTYDLAEGPVSVYISKVNRNENGDIVSYTLKGQDKDLTINLPANRYFKLLRQDRTSKGEEIRTQSRDALFLYFKDHIFNFSFSELFNEKLNSEMDEVIQNDTDFLNETQFDFDVASFVENLNLSDKELELIDEFIREEYSIPNPDMSNLKSRLKIFLTTVYGNKTNEKRIDDVASKIVRVASKKVGNGYSTSFRSFVKAVEILTQDERSNQQENSRETEVPKEPGAEKADKAVGEIEENSDADSWLNGIEENTDPSNELVMIDNDEIENGRKQLGALLIEDVNFMRFSEFIIHLAGYINNFLVEKYLVEGKAGGSFSSIMEQQYSRLRRRLEFLRANITIAQNEIDLGLKTSKYFNYTNSKGEVVPMPIEDVKKKLISIESEANFLEKMTDEENWIIVTRHVGNKLRSMSSLKATEIKTQVDMDLTENEGLDVSDDQSEINTFVRNYVQDFQLTVDPRTTASKSLKKFFTALRERNNLTGKVETLYGEEKYVDFEMAFKVILELLRDVNSDVDKILEVLKQEDVIKRHPWISDLIEMLEKDGAQYVTDKIDELNSKIKTIEKKIDLKTRQRASYYDNYKKIKDKYDSISEDDPSKKVWKKRLEYVENLIVRVIKDINYQEEAIETLKNERNYYIDPLSESKINKLIADEYDRLTNEFASVMNKDATNMRSILYRKSDQDTFAFQNEDDSSTKYKVLLDNWDTNMKIKMFKIDETGELVIDLKAAENIRTFFESVVDVRGNSYSIKEGISSEDLMFNLNMIFSIFGIDLSQETLDTIETDNFVHSGEAMPLEALFTRADGLLRILYNRYAKNVTEENYNKGSFNFENIRLKTNAIIKSLARIESINNPSLFTSSYRVGGKTIWNFVSPTYLTSTVGKVKTDPTFALELLNDPFVGKSGLPMFLRNMIDPDTGELKDTEATRQFNYFTTSLQPLKEFGADNRGGRELNKISEAEHELFKILLFQSAQPGGTVSFYEDPQSEYAAPKRIASFLFPTASDKTRAMGLSMEAFRVSLVDGEISDDVVNTIFKEVVEPEINMINSEVDPNISGYEDGKNAFYFIPSLNNLDVIWEKDASGKRTGNLLPIKGKVRKAIDNEIVEFTNTLIDEKIEMWEDLEIFHKTVRENGTTDYGHKFANSRNSNYLAEILPEDIALSSTDMSDKFDQGVRHVAADYVINYLVANAGMMRTFVGATAQFTKASVKTQSGEKYKMSTENFHNPPQELVEMFGSVEEFRLELIEQIYTNLGKRLAADIAPGFNGASPSESEIIYVMHVTPEMTSSSLEAIRKVFMKMAKNGYMTEEEASNLSDQYSSIDLADAQEYVTLREHLNNMLDRGHIGKIRYKELLDKVYNEGEELSETEIREILDVASVFQIQKPVFVDNIADQETGFRRRLYVKSSALPLLPQFTKGTHLDSLRKTLEKIERKAVSDRAKEKKIPESEVRLGVRSPAQSAVKVGNVNSPLKFFDSNGEFVFDYENMNIEDVIANNSITTDRKGLLFQQDVPYAEYKISINRVSQDSKLKFLNILNESGFNVPTSVIDFLNENEKFLSDFGKEIVDRVNKEGDITGKDLKYIYDLIWTRIYENSHNELIEDLGITTDNEGNYILTKKSVRKIANILREEAIERNYPATITEMFNIVDNDEAMFVKFMKFSPYSEKLESILTSIVDSRIIKQQMPGRSFILASELGYKYDKNLMSIEDAKKQGLLNSRVKEGMIFSPNYDPEVGLKSYGEYGFDQVFITSKFRHKGKTIDLTAQKTDGSYHFLEEDENGKLTLKIYDEARPERGGIDAEILKMYGMRIPNQGPNSTATIEIAGFLPSYMGDIIIAPRDFVTRMGSDFDIDKLYSYMYYHSLELGTEKEWKSRKNFDYKDVQDSEGVSELMKVLDQVKTYRKRIDPSSQPTVMAFIEKLASPSLMKIIEKFNISDFYNLHEDYSFVSENNYALYTNSNLAGGYNKELKELKTILAAYYDNNDKAIHREIATIVKDDVFSKMNYRLKRKTKGRQNHLLKNLIIDLTFAVSDSNNDFVKAQVMKPLNEWKLKEFADQLELVRKKNRSKSFSLLSDSYQRNKYVSATAGKSGTGVFSLDSVFNALVQNNFSGRFFFQQFVEGQYIPIDAIQIGDLVSHGYIDSERALNGEFKSDIISGYQSAAVDNEKLQLLGKLNVNSNTFDFIKAMTLLGFSYETIGMLNQPIILDYLKEVESLTNTIAEERMSYVEAKKEALDRMQKKYYAGNVKLDVRFNENIKAKDNLKRVKSFDSFLKQIELVESDNEGIKSDVHNGQLSFLSLYLYMTELGNKAGDLQKALQTDTKGVGISGIHSLVKERRFKEAMSNSGISNARSLAYQDVNGVEQPFGIAGSSMEFGVKLANAIFNTGENALMPYNTRVVEILTNEILASAKRKFHSERAEVEFRVKIYQHLKAYIYSNSRMGLSNFTDGIQIVDDMFLTRNENSVPDINSERARLFVDQPATEENPNPHMSLASIINYLLHDNPNPTSQEYVIRNAFLNRLTTEINIFGESEKTFSTVRYNNSASEGINDELVYFSFISMIYDNNQPILGTFNGIEYTPRRLALDLILAQYLSGGQQQAIEYTKYIPNVFMLNNRVMMEYLMGIDFNSEFFIEHPLYVDPFDSDGAHVDDYSHPFVSQFFQHSPEEVINIRESEIEDKNNGIKIVSEENIPELDFYMIKAFSIEEVLDDDENLINNKYFDIYASGYYAPKKFLTIYNEGKPILYRYEKGFYIAVPSLYEFPILQYNSNMSRAINSLHEGVLPEIHNPVNELFDETEDFLANEIEKNRSPLSARDPFVSYKNQLDNVINELLLSYPDNSFLKEVKERSKSSKISITAAFVQIFRDLKNLDQNVSSDFEEVYSEFAKKMKDSIQSLLYKLSLRGDAYQATMLRYLEKNFDRIFNNEERPLLILPVLGKEIKLLSHQGGITAGSMDKKSGVLTLDIDRVMENDSYDIIETMIHELFHYPIGHLASLPETSEQRKAVIELENMRSSFLQLLEEKGTIGDLTFDEYLLYKGIVDKDTIANNLSMREKSYLIRKYNWTKDTAEFISDSMSYKPLQKALNSEYYKEGSFLSMFINIIKKLLRSVGIDIKKDSYLEHAFINSMFFMNDVSSKKGIADSKIIFVNKNNNSELLDTNVKFKDGKSIAEKFYIDFLQKETVEEGLRYINNLPFTQVSALKAKYFSLWQEWADNNLEQLDALIEKFPTGEIKASGNFHINSAAPFIAVRSRRQQQKLQASNKQASKKRKIASIDVSKEDPRKLPDTMFDIRNHSGGEKGADIDWDEIGKEYGMIKNNHYYIKGSKSTKGNTEITVEESKEADEKLIRANRTLGRRFPTSKKFTNNLLRATWWQVKNSDQIIGISTIVDNIVQGGTGWAVQMGIDEGKLVFVFDQDKNQWYKWEDGKFVESGTPIIYYKNFAGIGSRNLNDNGRRAIRDVYIQSQIYHDELPFLEMYPKEEKALYLYNNRYYEVTFENDLPVDYRYGTSKNNLKKPKSLSGDKLVKHLQDLFVKLNSEGSLIEGFDSQMYYTEEEAEESMTCGFSKSSGGSIKAKFGYSTGTSKGKWKLIKNFKGKSHEQGGIDITINDGSIKLSKGNNSVKAENGLYIPPEIEFPSIELAKYYS